MRWSKSGRARVLRTQANAPEEKKRHNAAFFFLSTGWMAFVFIRLFWLLYIAALAEMSFSTNIDNNSKSSTHVRKYSLGR